MRRNRARIILSLALVAGTLAVFDQVLHHDFVNYDDDRYLVENPNVRNGLTGRGVLWAFTTRDAGFWIPLTFLSHMLDFQLFGPSPGGHHLTSLLIHSANTVLLFLVLVRLTGAFWQSAFVAALFAIHPLNVEPVAWVYERKGLLSTLFWVLSIWAYARYTERAGAGRYLVLLLLFSLGLMAKPMLVTLPFVLLLLDFWPLGRLHSGQAGAEAGSTAVHPEELRFRRTSAGRAILEKAPMLMIATLWGVLTMVGQRQIGALPSLDLFPVTVRIANSLVSYVTYLGKAFWPSHLATFYPHPGMPPWWKAITAAALLAAVSVSVIGLGRRRPYLAVGWFWFLGTLAPVIGMVQVGSHAMADRYAYLSLIGIFIMAAWGGFDILSVGRYGKVAAAVAALGVVAALGLCSWGQAGWWRNSTTLFTHAIEVTRHNYVAHGNLGNALVQQGRLDEAVGHYGEALRAMPDSALVHNSLGVALIRKGRGEEAEGHFTTALKIKPDYAEAHNNLGLALTLEGRLDEAIALFGRALRIDPEHADAHYNLGNTLLRQGKPEEGAGHYRRALRLRPDHAEAHNNLGVVLARQGKMDEAAGHFSGALRLKPDYGEARRNLERARTQVGKTSPSEVPRGDFNQ